MKWQPIETAPKDGTDILAFRPRPKRSSTVHGIISVRWSWLSDKWVSNWANKDVGQITHWMPLPEPPTDTGFTT